jgi:hypothetical protein
MKNYSGLFQSSFFVFRNEDINRIKIIMRESQVHNGKAIASPAA